MTLVLFAAWVFVGETPTQISPAPDYEVYATRVGITKSAPRKFFLADNRSQRLEVSFAFFVIRDRKRVVLVDTGFVRPPPGWSIEQFSHPRDLLTRLQIRPQDVTDVILTHGHWDHIGGLSLFDKARVWLHPKERGFIIKQSRKNANVISRVARETRLLTTHDGQEVAPGIHVHHVGLHTPGFQFVTLTAKKKTWVFASDIGPLWENFATLTPSGQVVDRAAATKVLKAILESVDGSLSQVLPGHDPELFGAKPIQRIAP